MDGGHLKSLSENQAKPAIPQVSESQRVEQVLWGKGVRGAANSV